MNDPSPTRPLRIAVSSCLLGYPTRYDGKDKFNSFLCNTWLPFFDVVSVCPETESGLPGVREPMRLRGKPEAPRLITEKSRQDVTDRVRGVCREFLSAQGPSLDGFILKSNSPSCGLSVPVLDQGKRRTGQGVFVAAIRQALPLLPLAEEHRLGWPEERERFLTSLFVLRRWRAFLRSPSVQGLITFHTRHKFLLLALSEQDYRAMGQVVAGAAGATAAAIQEYQALLLSALSRKPSCRKHLNALSHLAGFLKGHLSRGEKALLTETLETFRNGWLPLAFPLALLRHYATLFQEEFLLSQYYLFPEPLELLLKHQG